MRRPIVLAIAALGLVACETVWVEPSGSGVESYWCHGEARRAAEPHGHAPTGAFMAQLAYGHCMNTGRYVWRLTRPTPTETDQTRLHPETNE